MSKTISLQNIVGKGYAEFWHSRCRYVVCKGSRGSKKSKTAALWHIYNMMKYPQANTLVIRKVGETNRDSTYADLQWAIHRFGVDHLWKCTKSPLEITYIPTGQKILFRGLDNPLKITSISVNNGVLCWVWFEEAYQIDKESDFETVNESIRGDMPEGLFKRITITFNPWSELHWLKHRFFDIPNDDVLAMTTNYMCNEWLDESDRRLFEEMKKNRPNRYRVAGLGDWGIAEGLIYDNWRVEDLSKLIPSFDRRYNGLDFGWVDPTALVRIHYDPRNKRIYVFDEMYKSGLHNDQIAAELKTRIGNEYVTCDSAAPQSIDEIFKYGVRTIPTVKGADSILNGIQWLQQHDIIIDKSCTNFIREISQYHWDTDKFGNIMERPAEGQSDHALDALRYAVEPIRLGAFAVAAKRLT